MNDQILTKDKVGVDLSEEVARFSFRAGAVVCGLIGIWAVSCLLAALISYGPVEMITGYVQAVSGY